ncbi:MAG: hypothetical protein MI922_21840, partial [Bacteroidales bacterium]|nr:hypothetical protein [Bacteroidales bacterium]
MRNNELFYQASGKVNPVKMILSYAIIIGVTIFLAYAYSVLVTVIPIVYFNFILTIAFGMGLGLSCKTFARLMHNRCIKSQTLQAIVIGLLANYFQWTAYVIFVNSGTIPGIDSYLAGIIGSKNLFVTMAELYRIGNWSIFGFTLNGPVLGIIWIVEFALIIAGPVFIVVKSKIHPYSESLQKWYRKHTLLNDFESIAGAKRMTDALVADPINAIEELGKGSATMHTKIHVYFLKDEEVQYLNFERIFIEGHGKGKTNSTTVINNFKIDNEVAQYILDNY